MPTDIFPEINIPVVTVIWSYTGLSTREMEQRVTTSSEYSISSNVNGIKNIEAQTVVVVLVLALGGVMFPLVGRDFFPAIDGGQIQLHVRAPAGTRIESTERNFQAVEDKIREIIPESERELMVDNIGRPARSYNLAFADGSTIGVNDGVILVSLKEGHAPTSEYVRKPCTGRSAGFSPLRIRPA